MSKDNIIRLNSEEVGGEVINMNNMTHITVTETGYSIYFMNSTDPLNIECDTAEGRSLAHWITWLIAPVTEIPGSVSYRIRPE